MTAPRIDLELIAAELGMTPEQVGAHLLEAIDAGFLRIVATEGDHVLIEATTPTTRKETTR